MNRGDQHEEKEVEMKDGLGGWDKVGAARIRANASGAGHGVG